MSNDQNSTEDLTDKYAVCFQIIAAAGEAKSNFIGAYRAAAAGKPDRADELVTAGDKAFAQCHDIHLGVLRDFAARVNTEPPSQLLVHAEDQMASAETLREMATALMDVYARLRALEGR